MPKDEIADQSIPAGNLAAKPFGAEYLEDLSLAAYAPFGADCCPTTAPAGATCVSVTVQNGGCTYHMD